MRCARCIGGRRIASWSVITRRSWCGCRRWMPTPRDRVATPAEFASLLGHGHGGRRTPHSRRRRRGQHQDHPRLGGHRRGAPHRRRLRPAPWGHRRVHHRLGHPQPLPLGRPGHHGLGLGQARRPQRLTGRRHLQQRRRRRGGELHPLGAAAGQHHLHHPDHRRPPRPRRNGLPALHRQLHHGLRRHAAGAGQLRDPRRRCRGRTHVPRPRP